MLELSQSFLWMGKAVLSTYLSEERGSWKGGNKGLFKVCLTLIPLWLVFVNKVFKRWCIRGRFRMAYQTWREKMTWFCTFKLNKVRGIVKRHSCVIWKLKNLWWPALEQKEVQTPLTYIPRTPCHIVAELSLTITVVSYVRRGIPRVRLTSCVPWHIWLSVVEETSAVHFSKLCILGTVFTFGRTSFSRPRFILRMRRVTQLIHGARNQIFVLQWQEYLRMKHSSRPWMKLWLWITASHKNFCGMPNSILAEATMQSSCCSISLVGTFLWHFGWSQSIMFSAFECCQISNKT